MKQFAEQDGIPWSLTHCLFADMGGFVLRCTEQDTGTTLTSKGLSRAGADAPNPGQSDAKRSQVPLIKISEPPRGPVSDLKHKKTLPRPSKTAVADGRTTCSGLLHLNADRLRRLRKEGLIPKLPSISADEIHDRAKSDTFTKIIAIVQISWNALQVIVRGTRGLAISQLELAVIAFSLCAIIIYVLQWSKPKDVQTTYTVLRYDGHVPPEILEAPANNGFGFCLNVSRPPLGMHGAPLPNDSLWGYSSDVKQHFTTSLLLNVGLFLSSILFGAPHVAAWNFAFPNQTERNLWRAASVLCTALPALGYLTGHAAYLIILLLWPKGRSKDHFIICGYISIVIISFLYALARLFILVEIFRTLCFLPADAYISTWTTNIPHIM